MKIALADLPYSLSALEPHVSSEALANHHGKHHAAYVRKANELLEEQPARDIRDVFLTAYRDGDTALFRSAAQVWNHEQYWLSMRPGGGGRPSGAFAREIDRKFGDFDTFRATFIRKATELFGSGWVWLVLDKGTLGVMNTKDATNPLCYGVAPLLTLDVWEHAYYVDHLSERRRHVEVFLDHLVDWDFASRNFQQAITRRQMPVDHWTRR